VAFTDGVKIHCGWFTDNSYNTSKDPFHEDMLVSAMARPKETLAAKTWKVGDVVRILSGGPTMTVAALNTPNKNQVRCGWFVDGRYTTGDFNTNMLEEAETTATGSSGTSHP
jgi:uncharacterized protein YodC (DUF2158 family)